MAKKSFSAGATKPGILNSDGGEKLRKYRQKLNITFNIFPKKKLFLTQKMKCILKMA